MPESQKGAHCPFPSHSPKMAPPSETKPMPFSLRPYHRFPVQCTVTYHAGLFQGQGTVWDLSSTGWRPSGDLPMQSGKHCRPLLHSRRSNASGSLRQLCGGREGMSLMIIVAHQAIGIAEPAQTVDDLVEKGAPLRPIAVVTTMSWRVVPR